MPTGGLGNNSGFAGIRNLAWKLAYVLQGLADHSILDTYEIEHRPIATERIAFGVSTTNHMRRMMLGHRVGDDVAEHIAATHQYADYDHVLRGFEMVSSLIAPNDSPPAGPEAEVDFSPAVRSGCRAPHVWLDSDESVSVLDWYGRSYVLVLGPGCDRPTWEHAIAELGQPGPVAVHQLPADCDSAPYRSAGVVLVRPDGVIAAHLPDSPKPDLSNISPYLPWTTVTTRPSETPR